MTGKTLLHYEIKEKLGKGGMGEVFLARDTKLERDVAIKILPADLAGDSEREARFQREARALASLQHPHVASVYGFEEADGVRFMVMEYIDGAELTERMAKGPVPVDEALDIARQIAAGLEAAHESGIVHRDLKPANVMETTTGEIKVLDFGLAQAWFGDDGKGSESSSAMPTITAAVTQAGTILGTAAYMSPEQARGGHVDRRTDIWAFGVILYEMLTGQKLFHGETISDTLAAVLRAEPDWDALPDDAPALRRLIERCLERNPKQRLRDIGEARIFLQDGSASSAHLSFSQLGIEPAAAAPARGRLPIVATAIVALASLAIGAVIGWQLLATTEPAPLLHAMIPPPRSTDYDLVSTSPGPAMLSPDGTMLAFTATDTSGVAQLYLRHLDKGESVAISGTESAAYPFWSPDNESIGFFDMAGAKLRKVAVAGGPPVTLCPAPNGKGGAWNADGVIVFTPDANDPILRVPAIGGDPVAITQIGAGYNSHRHPRFLSDGEHFIYTARKNGGDVINDIILASLDTTFTPRVVATSEGQAEYAAGHLLTVREGVLMATPYDVREERVTEGGTPLVENVLSLGGAAYAVFSSSPTGMMIYQTGASVQATRKLFWVDVTTNGQQEFGEPGQIFHPLISPDGTTAVIEVRGASEEGTDLWLVDLATGLRTRFTFLDGDENLACWSRDSEYVFFMSAQDTVYRIVQQPVQGQGVETILVESDRPISPVSTGPDDAYLIVDHVREDANIDMRRLDLTDPNAELEIIQTAEDSNIGGGQVSPDGRWIAFHAMSAAGWDIFVIPAGGGTRKWQVTTDGAAYPVWNTTGDELWVSKFNGNLRAYDIDGREATLRVGSYRQTVTVTPPDATGRYYDLHPDGQRLLQTGVDSAFRQEVSFLHLVTDWQRALVQ